MLHTYRNLSGLVLRPGRGEPVHAGQLAELSMTLVNPSRLGALRAADRCRPAAEAADPARRRAPQAEKIVTVALATSRRGWMAAPRFTLSTTFPLGLWRAWTYWQPASRVLVHPWPETPAAPLPESRQRRRRNRATSSRGDEDFSALRPYREGDSMRRLAWKAMARSAAGDPLTKSFDGGSGGELLLDWRSLPASLDGEAQAVPAHPLGAAGGGRPASGSRWHCPADRPRRRRAHRAACLEALATFALAAPRGAAPGPPGPRAGGCADRDARQ